MTKYESETIINYNDEEATAEYYTCNAANVRRMDLLCEEYPDTFQKTRSDAESAVYRFPKRLISIRRPRVYTEEQRQKMSQAAKEHFWGKDGEE